MNYGIPQQRQRGFSLIELMIVVAIVAIIATIALPSYQAYVTRSKRTEGQVALMNMAQRLERCFTEDNAFDGDSCPTGSVTSESGYYNVSVSAAASTYLLSATPTFTDSDCGALTLSHTGAKNSATGGDCW